MNFKNIVLIILLILLNAINTNAQFSISPRLGVEIDIEKKLQNIQNQNINIDITNISSGIYYGMISNNNFTKNFLVSVIK